MRRYLLLLLLLLLPGLASVRAAEPFTNAAEEEERAAAEQEAEAAAAEAEEEDADAEDTTAARPEGNGDFVPSVQISEDLSVSFPTDI